MLLLLLPLAWGTARADGGEVKDSYLDAFMESHALPAGAGPNSAAQGQYPAAPSPPQTQYGAPSSPPQPQYGAPSPPQPQYGAPSPPQPQYGAPSPPQPQYGAPSPPQPQYGAPSPPQPQYGAPSSPPQPQYGAPSSPPQPQYGAPIPPQPQYGAPNPYGAATVTTTMTSPVSFFEGLGAGLMSLVSQLPLPDFHTALKILLKVIVIKGVIKLISLLLLMLFIPKLEDIVGMVSSLMEMEMDMTMDADKDDDKPPMKPEHKPGHHDDDEEAGDDATAMDDVAEAMQGESGRSVAAPRRTGAARARMLNQLAARVEEAVARTASAVRNAPDSPCPDGSARCGGRDDPAPQKKPKKKVVNKN